ncbi:excinuclease ABC subunit UvrA [Actinoplanes sp. NPDC051861]|uniref:excinuclease ABC subunit UvrA n=1 Tax=Actinoplanes sp. NPDC051861 TaxID=3155170 RepID=UPI00341E47A5
MATRREAPAATERDIRIAGARENNLKDVSLSIPKDRVTVFVGVSGSGKSSIVFDTVAVEAQRQLNATFPWSIRNQLPRYERPDVDAVENITTPVVIDQQPLGGNSRSTVGTITDIYAMIRTLFSRYAEPSAGRPGAYSFNDPSGMCPECDGLGRMLRPDPDLMLDRTKSIEEGAIQLPGHTNGSNSYQFYANYPGIDAKKKISAYSDEELQTLLYGTEGHTEIFFKNGRTQKLRFEGLVTGFVRRNLKVDEATRSEKSRAAAEKFIAEGECTACDGARLNAAALASRIGGKNIAEWTRIEVSDLIPFLDGLKEEHAAAPLIETVRTALGRIDAIGLGYLSLDRPTATLSGGEGQRLKLVKHLGSDLTGLTYIFDEPSIGMHPHDVGRLNDLLLALRDKGNTVIVVEHDPDVVQIADHVVEIGPRAGVHGGEIVFTGTLAELREADTATGAGLRLRGKLKTTPRKSEGKFAVKDVTTHNLKNVSAEIPGKVLTVVTGVAGAGKSSLIAEAFRAAHPQAVLVDQSPIPASSRSTPATYLDLMDTIRKLFAKANGVDAGVFSFNSKGACEECQGRGVLITEIAFMDPITTRCEACEGRRFKDSVLAHELRGKSVADVLEMSTEEAIGFFTEKPIRGKLEALAETGLGYLNLGQSLGTLSGGERQRLKLADHLSGTGDLFILDEPTTGLHLADVDVLLNLLDGLVDRGNTVVVIEHDLAVVEHADWIIDLGPEGGRNGGEVIFAGPPKKLLVAENSLTGEYLRRRHAPA